DPELLAPDAGDQCLEGGIPCRVAAADAGYAKSVGIVGFGVVEAAAIAYPAFVDLVVLVSRDPHQLIAPLPERDAAADRTLRAHGAGVANSPGPRREPPHAAGQGADGAEVDDVAAED